MKFKLEDVRRDYGMRCIIISCDWAVKRSSDP
jgi:hypothetical protein